MGLYYDQIANIYDATRPLPLSSSVELTDYILRLVKATPETKFLEPGIGTGRIALPFIQRGYSYTGVDISPEMITQLISKLPGVPDHLTLIQASAEALPFEDDTFDVVLTLHVLHLIPNWRSVLTEIRRVLKPNGFYLYCENLLVSHQKEFAQQWQRILAEKGYQLTNYSAANKEVIQLLVEQGAAVETVTAARWKVEQTVADLLKTYEIKPFASCWDIPQEMFPEAMQELRKWCQQTYESEDVILSSDATFDITVVRQYIKTF